MLSQLCLHEIRRLPCLGSVVRRNRLFSSLLGIRYDLVIGSGNNVNRREFSMIYVVGMKDRYKQIYRYKECKNQLERSERIN